MTTDAQDDGQALGRRRRHHGVMKKCGCPRRMWPKCPHSYVLTFRYRRGKHYRLALDKIAGRHLTKLEADCEADRIRTEIRAGRWGVQTPVLKSLTLAQLFETYERDVLAKRPRGTRPNDTSQISAITSAVLTLPTNEAQPFGAWLVVDITTAALEQFRMVRSTSVVVERQGRGTRRIGGPVGVNRLLGFIRRVFNWAILAGYMEATPFKRATVTAVKLPREPKRTRRLHDGEEDRLLPACGAHLRAVVECALETGMRRGEILGLQWMHLQSDEIRLTSEITKTSRGRTIPISSRLAAILALRSEGPDGQPHPPTAFVFGNEIGQQIKDVGRAWETAVLKAYGHTPTFTKTKGLTPDSRAALRAINLHFHDLRREAGSRWLEGGVPLHTIRDWLGHTSIAQTSTYLAGTMKTQRDAMRRFEAHRTQVQQSAREGVAGVHSGVQSADTSNKNPQENTVEHVTH